MASILDELVSYGPAFEVLDDEKAARSIVVDNMPEEAREEDIIIHFQKRKHGGGDIDNVLIIENTETVVVTFDSDEVARSVLERQQCLKDTVLELKPYPSLPVGPAELPEVFSRVTAKMEPDECGVSPQVLRKLLKKVQAEMTNMEYHEASDSFIVSGTFEELERYRELLQAYVAGETHVSVQGHQRGNDQSAPNERPANEETEKAFESFEVAPKFMRLLKRAFQKRLDAIESQSPVEIAWYGESTKVVIKPRPGCSDRQYQEGVDHFITLYQQLYSSMCHEVVELSDTSDDVGIQKAANQVMEVYPVLIERTGDKWSVYGEGSFTARAVKALKEKLGLMVGSMRRFGRQRADPANTSNVQASPAYSRAGSAPPVPLQHTLSNGVRVSVLQGDITSERADAIVNAANERLEHGGGVAGAIVEKGGFQIQQESRQIISHRGNLQVGEVVCTRAGNLPCKVVIHAVGPRWNDHDRERSILLLRLACISSLRLAAGLRMQSIAFPAISSGIFGMPREVCAETMFNAVTEYSNSVDAICGSLSDVRFVIIDYATVEVFKREFLRRYGSITGSDSGLHSDAVNSEDPSFKPPPTKRASRDAGSSRNDVSRHVEGTAHLPDEERREKHDISKNPRPAESQAPRHSTTAKPEIKSHVTRPIAEGGKKSTTNENKSGPTEGQSDEPHDKEEGNGSSNTKPIEPDFSAAANGNAQASSPSATPTPELSSHVTSSSVQGGKRIAANESVSSAMDGKPSGSEGNGSSDPERTEPVLSTDAGGNAQDSRSPATKPEPNSHVTSPSVDGGRRKEVKESALSGIDGKQSDSEGNGSSDPERTEPVLSTAASGNAQDSRSPATKPEPNRHVTSPSVDEGRTKEAKETSSGMGGKQSDPHFKSTRGRGRARRSTQEDVKHPPGLEQSSEGKTLANKFKETSQKQGSPSRVENQDPQSFTDSERAGQEGQANTLNDLGRGTKASSDIPPRSPGVRTDGSLPNPANPSPRVSETSSQSSEALPSSDAKTHPQDSTQTGEFDSSGQTDQEMFYDANTEGPPPLHGDESSEPEGNVKGDHEREAGFGIQETPGKVKPQSGADRADNSLADKEECSICLGAYENPEVLPKCGHKFCKDCIDKAFKTKKVCPLCSAQYGLVRGNQPVGYMTWAAESDSLPGHEDCGTIVVSYSIPDGTQGEEHPTPGQPFRGTFRFAYLPDSLEGREVLGLLKIAFDAGLIFTLNKPRTSVGENVVIWNTIRHKTNRCGGPKNNGYPDDQYLNRVKEELAALGIHARS